MKKVLFVCLGNICRSPLAEALFVHKITEQGLDHLFYVDSCGTNGQHNGESADPRTRKNAASHGIHVPSISRQIIPQDLKTFDYILTMDESVQHRVLNLCTSDEQSVKVLPFRHLDMNAPDADVQDPWYGGDEGFERVFRVIDKNCDLWIEHLTSTI